MSIRAIPIQEADDARDQLARIDGFDQVVVRADQHAAASVPGMDVRRLTNEQDSTFVTSATHQIDAQATADRVSETPTLLLGKTGSKLSPVSSAATFDPAKLAAAIRSSLG